MAAVDAVIEGDGGVSFLPMNAAEKLVMSYPEYLALERVSPVKMQFVDGVAYAMAGGSLEHAELAARLIVALSGLLQPGRGRCRMYTSDAKIHVSASGNSYYPDVSVVCGARETDPQDPHAITNPTLLVEVLSDTTESFDRGKKFKDYQRLASLEHYLLVNQDEARIEHFRRNPDGTWTLSNAVAGGAVRLPDLGGDLAVDEVYQAMEFTRSWPFPRNYRGRLSIAAEVQPAGAVSTLQREGLPSGMRTPSTPPRAVPGKSVLRMCAPAARPAAVTAGSRTASPAVQEKTRTR